MVHRLILRRIAAPALLALLGLSLTTRVAHAGEREEARRRFKEGMEAIANGQYEKGIADLKDAYSILPHPNVLYNIARAYAEMGDLEDAVTSYRKYLAENPPDKDEIEAVVRSLEARYAKSKAAAAAAAAATLGGGTTTGSGTPAVGVPPVPDNTAKNGGVGTDPGAGVPGKGTGVVPGTAPSTEIGRSKEENVYEEKVVTASKGAQSPLDSPNSTYVITEQDIRLSGLTNVAELLRRVPGIDFAQITPADYDLSMRGFNGRFANKLLVLVNGRSVFLDFLGTTFWDTLSFGVEDIERIEIVRGPGSALYGADAFGGVVNIITKTPGEGKSGVAATVGTQKGGTSEHGGLWAVGREKSWDYRVSAGFDRQPRWSREVGPGRTDLNYFLNQADQNVGQQSQHLDVRLTRRLGEDVQVGIGTGYNNFYRNFYGIGPFTDNATTGAQGDVTGFINTKHLNLRAFWNYFSANAGANAYYRGDPSYFLSAQQHVIDTELEYVTDLKTGPLEHDLHVGIGYRLKTTHLSYLDRFLVSENHFSAYGQDSIKIGEKVIVVGSLRGDYLPYYGKIVPSPRGSVIFKRTKDDAFRITVGSAFRAPSFLESYLDFPITTPLTGAELASQALRTDDPKFRIQPERIIATEIGYQNQASDFYTWEVNAYYNRVTDLIVLDSPRPQTPTAFAKGAGGYNEATGRYPAGYGGFVNDCQQYNVLGGELGLRTFPVTGLDLYGSYSLNYVNQVAPPGCVKTLADERTSHHKVTAGAQVRTRYGLDAELDMWFTSKQTWAEQQANFTTREVEYQQYVLDTVPILYGRVGYKFKREPLELGVAGTNLLNSVHREHPFGQLIGRRVMGQATYRF
ncbi:MAG: hypothetical protein NVS3B20_02440 [Polyangiales bacterium]